jgi:5-methylcytosine-specific restriction endonuclease McrA
VSTKRKRAATAKELYQLVEKQDYRCALSGMKITPKTSRIDHKTPVSVGGSDEIENLQWVHEELNRMKGSLDNDEFIEICRKVAQWVR